MLVFTGNIALDKNLQIALYGVGCGMSASWWRIQHNKHHAMPQKLGHDVDLNTLPLVAFTEKVRIGNVEALLESPYSASLCVISSSGVKFDFVFMGCC